MAKYKTLFHGTTKENYDKIINSNFGEKESCSWYCSDDNNLYFYDLDKTDADEKEYKKEECINRAFESAQLTASISNYKRSDLVVIELKVLKSLCSDDESCQNMENVATQVHFSDLDISMIKNVYNCENGYIQSLRLLYCAGLLKSNEHINTDNFSSIELDVANKVDFEFYEDLHYFEYKKEVKEFI